MSETALTTHFIMRQAMALESGCPADIMDLSWSGAGSASYVSPAFERRKLLPVLLPPCRKLGRDRSDPDGRDCAFGYVAEIGVQQRVEADLRLAAATFESQEGMIITDANAVILRINKAFSRITGYAADEVVGRTPRMFKSGRHDADFYGAMWETIVRSGGWQGEIWDRRKNGELYPKWLTISAVKDEFGSVTHYISTHSDMTERKNAEERIRELAFFDQLTGLPNRTLLSDRLTQALVASARGGKVGAVLFIDLDNFKTLNDTLGHDHGDALLKLVAKRVSLTVREGDTVARLGGDEFVLVLPELNADKADAASAAKMIAQKILVALDLPFDLGEVSYRIGASIGVTLFGSDKCTADEVMKHADLAMYKAKASGHNLIRFYDPALETAVKERAAWEEDLRQAMAGKQFVLHYQPQLSGQRRLIGAEALVRWQHPTRGMVSAADFIPLAEETDLILPLGQWVLETACRQLAAWAGQPALAHLTLAVNVSAHQFHHPEFVDQVMAIVHETGANPCRLKLELTESLLLQNVPDVIDKMAVLRAEGVGFSLDDFGTGYSSLSNLRRLPLDQLKIDQSFVRDMIGNPQDAVIVRTIIALARSLGLDVIAEGVETEAQVDFLTSSGCQGYQSFYFSRPLPLEGFEEFARRDRG